MGTASPNNTRSSKPAVVACAGCAEIAKVANDIAVSLSENQLAEMVAASSIGANILPIIQACKNNKRVISIDGCGLCCAKRCLEEKDIHPHQSITLTDLGIVAGRDDKVSIMQSAQLIQRVYQALGFGAPSKNNF